MELAIPYQKLEISKMYIIPQTTGYLPFEYKDGDLTLHRAVILTPTLTVSSFQEDKGKIEFECEGNFIAKIDALQEVLKSLIFLQQKMFMGESLTRDKIDYGFKLLTYGGSHFVCFIPSKQLQQQHYNKWSDRLIHVVDGNKSEYLPAKNIFTPGATLKLAIKFGGIKIKTGPRGTHFFIDHTILHVWKQSQSQP